VFFNIESIASRERRPGKRRKPKQIRPNGAAVIDASMENGFHAARILGGGNGWSVSVFMVRVVIASSVDGCVSGWGVLISAAPLGRFGFGVRVPRASFAAGDVCGWWGFVWVCGVWVFIEVCSRELCPRLA